MASTKMNWNRKEKRWRIQYRGKKYAVSPRQLNTPYSEEASRPAAREWWKKKQKEIDDVLGTPKQHSVKVYGQYQHAIAQWALYAKWNRLNNDVPEANRAETQIAFLQEQLKRDAPIFPLPKRLDDPLWGLVRDMAPDEEADFRLFWFDRFRTVRLLEKEEEVVSRENTIVGHIDAYLDLRKAQAETAKKPEAHGNTKQWLNSFRNWVSPKATLDTIDEQLWEQYFLYLGQKVANGDLAPKTMQHYQNAARAFIVNRYEAGIIDKLPRNIRSRSLSVEVPLAEVITFTVEEIRTLLSVATPRQKLYILLALNCGMYPSDIGLMTKKEVDLDKGRITRKRTKTRNKSKKVPTVDYQLWKTTRELLTKFYNQDNPLPNAILSSTKKPLYLRIKRKSNSITKAFNKTKKKAKSFDNMTDHSWLNLRKTGATMIAGSDYGRFSEHYLGDAPTTIASRHYIHENGPKFDEAVRWLGDALGIE